MVKLTVKESGHTPNKRVGLGSVFTALPHRHKGNLPNSSSNSLSHITFHENEDRVTLDVFDVSCALCHSFNLREFEIFFLDKKKKSFPSSHRSITVFIYFLLLLFFPWDLPPWPQIYKCELPCTAVSLTLVSWSQTSFPIKPTHLEAFLLLVRFEQIASLLVPSNSLRPFCLLLFWGTTLS